MFTEIERTIFVDLDAEGEEVQRIVFQPHDGMVPTLSANYLPGWLNELEANRLLQQQNQEVTLG
jgi:hypothetical protein